MPKSTAVLPIRLRSYRWRLVTAAGTSTMPERAPSRAQIEQAIDSYRRSRMPS